MTNITYRMADYENVKNMPEEIRQINAWCLAGASKAPITIRDGEPVLGDVNDPSTFLPFEMALRFARCLEDEETYYVDNTGQAIQQTGYNLGFVLTENDPFAVIDLDDHGDLTDEDKQRHDKIVETFASYTEKSSSGKGLHVWLKSNLTANVRRDHVECYTSNHFIICTGNDTNVSKTIENRDNIFVNMIEQMRSDGQEDMPYISRPAIKSDEWVLERCEKAATGHKFTALWSGDLSGYPSQSEADLALVTYLGFFTPDDEQVYRLFLQSALGQREKAHSEYHRNRLLRKMRQNSTQYDAPRMIDDKDDFEVVLRNLGLIDADTTLPSNQNAAPEPAEPAGVDELIADMQEVKEIDPEDAPVVNLKDMSFTSEECGSLSDYPEMSLLNSNIPLEFPDSNWGKLAEYVYSISPVPLVETAMCASLAVLAGICGKAWSVSGKGLNLYILLVARSMSGKDILRVATGQIFRQLEAVDKDAANFLCMHVLASAQALQKHLEVNHCCIHSWGEMGKDIETMAKANGSTVGHNLRQMLLKLFSASDVGARLGSLKYSKAENNSQGYDGSVAYSLLGETTPTVFDSLNSGIFADGTMGRFLVIEYRGIRKMPILGLEPKMLPPDLFQRLTALVRQAINHEYLCSINIDAPKTQVRFDKHSLVQVERFGKMLFLLSNQDLGDMKDQSLGRAMEKILKVSALQAVFDNPDNPVITMRILMSSAEFVFRDIRRSFQRFDSGDIGSSDETRLQKMGFVIQQYQAKKPKSSYRVNLKLWRNGIIERSFLMNRCYSFSCFKSAGSMSNAFESALRDMIKNGALIEQNQSEIKANYNVNAICYKLGDKI